MHDLMSLLDARLAQDEPAALATVVGRRGSVPMSGTARMLVCADGGLHGTVGGGCLEAEVYATGRRLLQTGGARLETFHLNELPDGLGGHVCGGTVEILCRALRPTRATRALVARLLDGVRRRDRAVLIHGLPDRPGIDAAAGWALVSEGGGVLADGLAPADDVLDRCHEILRDGDAPVRLAGDGPLLLEPLVPDPIAWIFGAGHCGRAIARMAGLAGFGVHVLDDRPAFLDEVPGADRAAVVDFASLGDLRLGADDYVIIVTRGHEHDLTVLRQLIAAPVAYLGMIGSRRKRILFERTLRAEDAREQDLSRLRSPIGLDIGADSPEEIAVAVLAEMIAVRRRAGSRLGADPVREAAGTRG